MLARAWRFKSSLAHQLDYRSHHIRHRGVAQWLARSVRDAEVGGSSPLTPTNIVYFVIVCYNISNVNIRSFRRNARTINQ